MGELTPEEIRKDIIELCKSTHWKCNACSHWVVDEGEVIDKVCSYIEAQLTKVLTSFKIALEQPKGEPIDLSPEAFEVFSAIHNDGIAKSQDVCPRCKGSGSRIVPESEFPTYRGVIYCPACQGTGKKARLDDGMRE